MPASWTKESGLTIGAEAELDASRGIGPGATLTLFGIAGDLTLRVPPGTRVRDGGVGLFGDRGIDVAPGDGPEVVIKVYGLFTDVHVTDRTG